VLFTLGIQFKESSMANYAKIENNTVVDVIVAEQAFIDSGAVGDPNDWILADNIGIGFEYSSEHNRYIPPQPEEEGTWQYNAETNSWEPVE